MSADLITTLRAIVRDELASMRPPELGVVTQVHAREDEQGDGNHQMNVKLCASAVELHRVPLLVSRLGWSALPNEGDLMLILYVGGDLNAPVAIGGLYDDRAHPPVAKSHETVYLAPDPDDSSIRRLHFELKNGNTLTVKDETLEVVLGGTSVTVHKDGDVEIKAAGKVSIDADGDLALSSAGSVSISAQRDVSVKATMKATLEGTTQAQVKGAQITLAGITQLNPA